MVTQYLRKIQLLFTHPTRFFKSVEKEKEYWPILIFFAVVSLISGVLGILFSIPQIISYPKGEAGLFTLPISFMMVVVMAFAGPFIVAGITHLGVLLLGGKQGFFNTFKPMTYAGIVYAMYSLLGSLIGAAMFMIQPPDMQMLTQLILEEGFGAYTRQALPYLIPGAIILIINVIHVTVNETIGLSHFQKMSKVRAFVAVFVLPIVFLLAIMVVMGLLLGLLIWIAS